MCRFTNANALYSDVVRKNSQFKYQSHDSVAIKFEAKTSSRTSSQLYGKYTYTESGVKVV